MKPGHPPDGPPPTIKGIPTAQVIGLWRQGQCYGDIQRRYPRLTWADIDGVVHAQRYAQVRRGLAEGKTTTQLAKELHLSPASVWATKRRAERTETLRKHWGGLSPRAVTLLKRLGYGSLAELENNPPTEERVFWTKGVGIYLFNEIKNVVPLKPGKHPVEVIARRSVSLPPEPWREPRLITRRQEKPPVYVTKQVHYREALESPVAPESAQQFARFLDRIVQFARMVPMDETLPSDIPCMAGPGPRRWCLGVVDVCWATNPLGVYWECPVCNKRGIITDVDCAPAPPISEKPGGLLH